MAVSWARAAIARSQLFLSSFPSQESSPIECVLVHTTTWCDPRRFGTFLSLVSREARIKWNIGSPPAFFRFDEVGRSRKGRLISSSGPSQSKELRTNVAAIASELIRMHTRTAKWTTYRITGYSHGDRPQMVIAGVHHTCHIMSGQMYEEQH